MTLQPAVESSAVDKPAKAAKPAARERTAAARTTPPSKRTTAPRQTPVEVVEPAPDPLPAVAVKTPRHYLRVTAGFGLVLAAAVAALLFVNRSDDAPAQDSGAPVTVSPAELASFAGSLGAPVYWAGLLRARTLELTRTDVGTFVRYLPAGATVGGSNRALTVATYPMRGAYTTATRRATVEGIASRRTRNHGLAVWNEERPTSVYVTFRGVPSLIEVYSPQAKEARTLALSGQLRPVR